jgi:hypothetical protein
MNEQGKSPQQDPLECDGGYHGPNPAYAQGDEVERQGRDKQGVQ